MPETHSSEGATPTKPGARSRILGFTRRLLSALGWFLLGNFVLLVALGVLYLNGRPELSIWHTAELDEEFHTKRGVDTFPAYLQLEERLFKQLDERVVAHVPVKQQSKINRYTRNSLSDPSRWPRNWNRSYELPAEHPKAVAILVHGMSDSPYSLHTIAERLSAEGVYVVGLRLPGHGTIPDGLVDVTWRDLAAAVELAVRHAKAKSGGVPLYFVGFSTGGALGVHYALRCLDEPTLPKIDGLVLLSPAVAVPPAAAIATWQSRLGHLFGLKKLEWESLGYEYDPFKYNSFAINATDVVYRLSLDIESRFDAAGPEKLDGLPPILAFQSGIDATVSTPAVVASLFDKLRSGGHEVVLFDINRHVLLEQVIANDPRPTMKRLLEQTRPAFDVTVVTNANPDTMEVIARTRKAGQPFATDTPLDLEWPPGIFSLSHIAIPIRYDDPLYGGDDSVASPGIKIGRTELHGERGVLMISPNAMLRLRWNPFYPWMETRMLEFMHLTTPTPAATQ